MSITVEDCLNLPSLNQAKVAAGASGLSKIVNSITVLEYADISLISADLFINQELCITAFTTIKNDVEAQCGVLRKLRECGVVGVLLYYVGIFVPYLDQRLISTADEIELPLICMPSNRFDFRYSEVISDVMTAICNNRQSETSFLPEMLELISQLPEHRRSTSHILRLLSDRLYCSFLLLDSNLMLKCEALWPMSTRWSYLPLLEELREDVALSTRMHGTKRSMDQKDVFISCLPVTPGKTDIMYLLAIDNIGTLTEFSMTQAAELVGLYLNIWNHTFEKTTPDMLVKAILNDEPIRVHEIAGQHNINTSDIQSMWVLYGTTGQEKPLKQDIARCVSLVKNFMSANGRWALVDSYRSTVVILFKDSAYTELDSNLADTFLNELSSLNDQFLLFHFNNLLTIKDSHDDYQLLEECASYVQIVYPRKQTFNIHDLRFVESCLQIIAQGEPHLSDRLYPISMLSACRHCELLIETLAVYMLDANENSKKASELMYLHVNTIRYRMEQIRKCFNESFSQMPLASALYQATALLRLLHR